MADRFPSPFEMADADRRGRLGGAVRLLDGLLARTAASYEDSMFWFMDGVHSPEVDPAVGRHHRGVRDDLAVGQYNTRHYVIPPALGVDIRS